MPSRLIAVVSALLLSLSAAGAQNHHLIPAPASVEPREGYFVLTPQTVIVSPAHADLADYLGDHIWAGYGFRPETGLPASEATPRITISTDPSLPAEGYTLNITPAMVSIAGGSRTGAFYGLQTLFQLMTPAVFGGAAGDGASATRSLRCVSISDSPRYPYRGVMLDVSRTFFDKSTVLRYLDWMSRHKLNKFHWHLTDDDGWRIEIKKYPELTAKGGWRGPSEVIPAAYGSGERRYGGFYTREEICEVVAYAAFRGIEVIPEIELPGHSRVVRAIYPEIFCRTTGELPPGLMRNTWCAGREENYAMIRDILSEVAELFPSKTIHIGGDEVNYRYWKACPRCQAKMRAENLKSTTRLQGYFMSRVERMLAELGKRGGAWNEVTKTNPGDTTLLIYGWEGTDACREALAQGNRVVAMPASYCYIDMKQGPGERGHTWAWLVDTRRLYSFDPSDLAPTAAAAERLVGLEGAQFAELMAKPERFLEYQGYPRLCALAEVGWSAPERREWDGFYTRLTEGHFARLAAMGLAFRVFPPEVAMHGDTLTATSTLPLASLEYTTDPDPLTASYHPYTGPVVDSLRERYLFRTRYNGSEAVSPGVPAARSTRLTLKPHETRTVSLPLKDYIDRDGIWWLAVVPEHDNTRLARFEIGGPDTTYTIIGGGQRANPFGNLRIYADANHRSATARLTLTNNNDVENALSISLRPSPYIEPAVRVSASFGFARRFPGANLSDYNLGTYARSDRACRSGDHVTFTFAEPVRCSSIRILTGIPDITRYIVTRGTVEYSADGSTYTEAGAIDPCGEFVLQPEGPVKSIRLRIGGFNGETQLSLQDLRIRR